MSLKYEPASELLHDEESVFGWNRKVKITPCHLQGYLANRNTPLLGPYSRTMPRALCRS